MSQQRVPMLSYPKIPSKKNAKAFKAEKNAKAGTATPAKTVQSLKDLTRSNMNDEGYICRCIIIRSFMS